jgi:hypothetical protein
MIIIVVVVVINDGETKERHLEKQLKGNLSSEVRQSKNCTHYETVSSPKDSFFLVP